MTRWCDAPGYVGPSRGDPENTVYLLCTPYSWLTVRQEHFCWRYALHGVCSRARREAGYSEAHATKTRGYKPLPQEAKRVADLLVMHAEGVIDLKKGPWDYYNYMIDPCPATKQLKDYGDF